MKIFTMFLIAVLVVMFAMPIFSQEVGRVDFYMSPPDTVYLLPYETYCAQYGIYTVNESDSMVSIRSTLFHGDLSSKFYVRNLWWQRANIGPQGQDMPKDQLLGGTTYLNSSFNFDDYAWYSNTERGIRGLFLMSMVVVNGSSVGTAAYSYCSTEAGFNDLQNAAVQDETIYITQDGIRGDVTGDGYVNQDDVSKLALYREGSDMSGRYVKDGLNYGRGCVLFSHPDIISTWLLNVHVYDSKNSILIDLGIGEDMSIYPPIGGINNVSFTVADDEMDIITTDNVVNISTTLSDGTRWQITEKVLGGSIKIDLPDSKLEYLVESANVPGLEMTDVEMSQLAPVSFELKQNYPNPFNPSTVIPFSVQGAGHVSLKVFDLVGREVANLIDGNYEAGSHEAIFNASELPSGTYLCRLRIGANTAIRKMLLIK